mmetsp:Transcript_41177/g.103832  ORF Transcript_41177/g.103832 Transcript_41177/m.103832 type:complete len:728 (-) Transcript_41177:82-2265(-)|eukprot:CAMPEP_0177669746 /NCGR_PEP_ID=MMETSP0447-20121125/23651_1 /TAXON_ID=0 /ORGANISM="Stygamoeba regulata, Strain BSH-02190019" /LENGTH=727 /DNA_ID=CAMNT_0019176725 /DNA_START=74 /DNA_END=2257 /DNA_ORIENTATION=-
MLKKKSLMKITRRSKRTSPQSPQTPSSPLAPLTPPPHSRLSAELDTIASPALDQVRAKTARTSPSDPSLVQRGSQTARDGSKSQSKLENAPGVDLPVESLSDPALRISSSPSPATPQSPFVLNRDEIRSKPLPTPPRVVDVGFFRPDSPLSSSPGSSAGSPVQERVMGRPRAASVGSPRAPRKPLPPTPSALGSTASPSSPSSPVSPSHRTRESDLPQQVQSPIAPFRQKRLPTPAGKVRSRTVAIPHNPTAHRSFDANAAVTPAGTGCVLDDPDVVNELSAAKHTHSSSASVSRRKKRLQTKPDPSADSSSSSSRTERPSSLCMEYSDLTIDCSLASGTFGQVSLGTFKGKKVAIKVFKGVLDSVKKEFQDELEIYLKLSQLKSENVVYCYGGCLEPVPSIVMEFCSNGSLYSYMKRKNVEFTWKEVFHFAEGTLRGLQVLHDYTPSILHRDLKSHNLLLSADLTVKLCDFGLARFNVAANHATLAKARGSYEYMAPEIMADASYTISSDMYSFSVVLWEMVCRCIFGEYKQPYHTLGKLPIFAVMVRVMKGLRPQIPDKCPKPLSDIIEQCWSPEVSARPDTQAVLQELVRICPEVLDSEPSSSLTTTAAAPTEDSLSLKNEAAESIDQEKQKTKTKRRSKKKQHAKRRHVRRSTDTIEADDEMVDDDEADEENRHDELDDSHDECAQESDPGERTVSSSVDKKKMKKKKKNRKSVSSASVSSTT